MGNIVIIDDSIANLAILKAILDDGYVVRPALSAGIALKSIFLQTPDLVIADVNTADRNGPDSLAALKSSPATEGIPIILVGSDYKMSTRERAYISGCAAFLSKPYLEVEVLKCVAIQMELVRLRKRLL